MAPAVESTNVTTSTTISAGQELVDGSQVLKAAQQPDSEFQSTAKADPILCQVHGNHDAPAHPVPFEQGQNSIKAADNTQSKKNIVYPSLAKKLATGVAVLGASIALPVRACLRRFRMHLISWRSHVPRIPR
eukprot:s1673_g4.t1